MTYRLPSLNTLRAFEAAARHASFKTAAHELGVTAGAVSQQVKKLESSLGIALFRRLPHGLVLTAEAETYLPAVTQVFEDLTTATEAIAPEINSRKFRVGISADVQARLPARWPRHDTALRRHVRDCVVTSDVDLLRTNALDCLIRATGGPYRDLALVLCPTNGDTLHFVCRPGLANCIQAKAIVTDLALHLADRPDT